MLQINTGKLFTRPVGRTNQLRGVLYTNARLPWQQDIVTAAGTLRSTDSGPHGRAVVYELEERIEEAEIGPGVLASHGVSSFLQDFSVVASFALNAVVSPDPSIVARLSGGRAEFASYRPPREFVRRFFDEAVWVNEGEASDLIAFVDQLLALDRKSYLAAMRAMRTFVAGMHRMLDDLGLAYTLLVSAVESLAQDFDAYQTTWLDVDERKRKLVGDALRKASPNTADKVRLAVAAAEHASLGRRYREFVLARVGGTYFREGDALLGRAVGRRELGEALRQAYSIRSRYVHGLKQLPSELTLAHDFWESTSVGGRPALSFQGLSRLTRHVIRSFITDGPKVDREPYNYTLEQAGVVSMRMAAEYWIWQPLRNPREARQRFGGLLEQLMAVMSRVKDAKLTNLNSVLADVERLMPRAPKVARPAMYALHVLFNSVLHPDQQRPGWRDFMEKYAELGDAPVSENLIARTIFGSTDEWSLEHHRAAYDRYWSERWTPTGLHAPRLFEAGISLALAERYRAAGNLDQARCMLESAVDNHPGHSGLAALLVEFDGGERIKWREALFPLDAEEGGAEGQKQEET